METKWIGKGSDKLASNPDNWSNGVPQSGWTAYIDSDVDWNLPTISVTVVFIGNPKIHLCDNCKLNGIYYVPEILLSYHNLENRDHPPPNIDVNGVLEWNKSGRSSREVLSNFGITMREYGSILDTYDAARTWGGGSSMTGNWGDGTCWTGDTVPGAGDDITFDSTNTTACAINVDTAALGSLTVATTYSSTITVGINQTGTKGTFTISGGTGVYNTNGYNEFFTTVTLNSGSSLIGGASSISVGGTWSDIYGNFSVGTSTVTFTANANYSGKNNYAWTGDNINGNFYNLIINNSVTVTMVSNGNMNVKNVATVNGTLAGSKNLLLGVSTAGTANSLVIGVSGVLTTIGIFFYGNVDMNCPAVSCRYIGIGNFGGGHTVTMTGNMVTSADIEITPYGSTTNPILTTSGSNYSITCGGSITFYYGTLTCNASVVSCVTFLTQHANDIVSFGTSSWTCSGNWTNISTSASWDDGTSTVNFNGSGTQVLGLNNGNSANITYYNITISNGGSVNITMGANTTTVTGALNCSTTTATIKWDTNNGNLTLAGAFTLANGCTWTKGSGTNTFNGTTTYTDSNASTQDIGTTVLNGTSVTQATAAKTSGLTITLGTWSTSAGNKALTMSSFTRNAGSLNGNGSAISCGGSWTCADAGFTYGTSTVTFTGNGTIGATNFYNLTINLGVTTTLSGTFIDLYQVTTVNGTLTGGTLYTCFYSCPINALVLGGSADVSGATLRFDCVPNNINIPAATYGTLYIFPTGSGTAFLQGNIIATSIYVTNNLGAASWAVLDTTVNNYSVTATTLSILGYSYGRIIGRGSVFNITNFHSQYLGDYITFNTSTWNVTGNWTVLSSTSANWNCGTATINFNGSGTQTLAMNGGNSANITYYNITISNSSAGLNVTIGANTIRVNGLLNISSTSCVVTETVNNPVWSLYGGITKADGSTWNRGSGMMTFYDTQTLTDNTVAHTDLITGTVNAAGKTITMTTGKWFNFSTSLHIVAGTFTTADKVQNVTNNGTWNKTGGGSSTVTLGSLLIDLGTTLNSGDSPPRVSEPFEMDLPIRAACF